MNSEFTKNKYKMKRGKQKMFPNGPTQANTNAQKDLEN